MSFNYFTNIAADTNKISLLDGNSFSLFIDRTYGADATINFLVKTPSDKDILFYGRSLYSADGAAEFKLFRDTVVSANGNPIASIGNLNGNSSKTSSMLGFEAPTITSDGVQIDMDIVGSAVGVPSPGSKFTQKFPKILKRNTNYLLRIKNTSGVISARIIYSGVWEEREI